MLAARSSGGFAARGWSFSPARAWNVLKCAILEHIKSKPECRILNVRRHIAMPSRFLIVVISLLSGTVWVAAFLLHGWYLFGALPNDILEVYGVALVASLILSVLIFGPSLTVASRISPGRIRKGVIVSVAILLAMLLATLHLTELKHYPLDPQFLIGRAWNVYVYYLLFGATYGFAWAWMMPVADARNPIGMRNKRSGDR